MSLRARLIASIVLVLVVCLGLGGAVAGWHAVRSVRTEMQSALAVGIQTMRNGINEIPGADNPDAETHRLVRTFDGDRHLRAILQDDGGAVADSSTVATLAPQMPGWFVALLAPRLDAARLPLPRHRAIVLEPDPHNEIGEVWTQLRDDLVADVMFCGLSIVLVSFVAGRALRPLDRLAAALDCVASGEYAVRVPRAGPPELDRLAKGFNAMTARLEEAQAQNLRLHEQLSTLQEEERADLARDLHDEVGPFLFAVHLDAAAIDQAASMSRTADVRERARAIREAVTHMQRQVRAMLLRLRPASPIDDGLSLALANLVAFWRARRPAIAFALTVSVDDDVLDEPTSAAIYRLVQEGLNNAVRHGQPRRIDVVVEWNAHCGIEVRVVDDGRGIAGVVEPGLGLAGMRERVMALGGTLSVGDAPGGTGLAVVAQLPGGVASRAA